MVAKNKKITRLSLLGLGALFAFLSLTALAAYLVANLVFRNNSQEVAQGTSKAVSGTSPGEETEVSWRLYTNEEFSYEVLLPGFLYKREFINEGGYEHFIRFEETAFSVDKGVAIGVTRISSQEELEKMKNELGQDSELVDEKNVFVSGIEAVYLRFVPNFEEAEERAFVVFEKEGLTYSISTTPEQIDRVLESFKLTN